VKLAVWVDPDVGLLYVTEKGKPETAETMADTFHPPMT